MLEVDQGSKTLHTNEFMFCINLASILVIIDQTTIRIGIKDYTRYSTISEKMIFAERIRWNPSDDSYPW